MIEPSLPLNEHKRLKSLYELNLLDTEPEQSYDNITKLVAAFFEVPIVAISLIDSHRQWFKSIQGLDVCETSRGVSFCAHSILEDDLFIVEDASKDERFADNPLVQGDPEIRYYASTQLKTENGDKVGGLCIIDREPRQIPRERLECLKYFAELIEIEFLSRRRLYYYMSQLADIQTRYINGDSTSDIYNAILQFILSYTSSEYGFIGAIQDDVDGKPFLRTYAISNIAWSDETRAFYEANAPQGLEFKNLDTLFGHTIKTGELVVSNDPSNDPRSGGLPDGHPAMNAYLGMPVKGQTGFIAMFGLANRPGGYTKAVIEELQPITSTIASIVESSKHHSALIEMAIQDPLTELGNRRHFKESLKKAVEAHQKSKSNFAVLMIDLDNFKQINDTLGHDVGDRILRKFAKRLTSVVKQTDVIARFGGDEFVVLLNNIQVPTGVGNICERIMLASSQLYDLGSMRQKCSCSIGVACYPFAGEDVSQLFKSADIALYEAKKTKNNWRFYTKELSHFYYEQVNIEQSLLVAVSKKMFFFEYQPKVNLVTSQIEGVELLLRWKNDIGKSISPSIFVPILERLGKADFINHLVIDHIIDNASLYESVLHKPCKFAVNISPHVPNFAQHIKSCLLKLEPVLTAHSKLKIEIEMTESDYMLEHSMNQEAYSEASSALKKAGIGLAIDDFGVEYSSLRRLVDYPFDTIKIDRSFVSGLSTDKKAALIAILRAIINLAGELNYEVIAEGLETEDDVKALRELGCIYAQGYYFYRPMPQKQLLDLLKQQSLQQQNPS